MLHQQTGVDMQVHVNGEGLWYGAAKQSPQRWEGTASEFADAVSVQQASRVSVLGTKENSELIVALHNNRLRTGLPARVRIGTPSVLAGCDSVLRCLSAMRDLHYPASLGGWCELSRTTVLGFAIWRELQQHGYHATDDAKSLLRLHPAWPALSFLPFVDEELACHLVCEIGDPRWYMDRKTGESRLKLHSYMGLHSQVLLRQLLEADGEVLRYAPGRKRTALSLWTWLDPEQVAVGGPSWFLHRLAASGHHKIQGFLSASRLFVEYVCGVWLQGLVDASWEVFVPEHFFPYADTASAFRSHWESHQLRRSA